MSKTDNKNNHLAVTTHAGVAQTLARALAVYGVDRAAVFASAGLGDVADIGGDQRVAATAMQKVWRAAPEITGDEAFGITFARQFHPAALQGLGFACVVSDTLYDVFMRLVRYYRVIASAGEILVEEDGDQLRLLYRIPGERGAAATASLDAALALFLQLCRLTKDEDFTPLRAEMQRAKPGDATTFDEFFRCPIQYEADENALYFDREELNQPLPMANPELARANDQVIIDYLRRFDESDIVSQVRSAIIESLPSGAPSQESIARFLNMSARTLQRRLAAAGPSFTELLESIRSELAQQYLAVPGRSIGEVAYLLGFSEPGNFSRSFKRWTGQTPAQYQAGG